MTVLMAACAPKPVLFDVSNVPANDRCDYMKDVCKEAEKFQAKFESMTREEKEDAKAVMSAYSQQCKDAQDMCRQTIE